MKCHLCERPPLFKSILKSFSEAFASYFFVNKPLSKYHCAFHFIFGVGVKEGFHHTDGYLCIFQCSDLNSLQCHQNQLGSQQDTVWGGLCYNVLLFTCLFLKLKQPVTPWRRLVRGPAQLLKEKSAVVHHYMCGCSTPLLNSPQYLHSSLRGSSTLMVETSFVLHMSVSAFLCFTIADSPECHHQAWLGEHKPAGRGLSCVRVLLFTCLCSTGSDNSGYYSVSQAQTTRGTALFHRLRQTWGTALFHRLRQVSVLLCFTGSDSSGHCSVSQTQLRVLLCFTGSDSSGYCSVSQIQTAQGTALFHRLSSGYCSVSQIQTAQGTALFHRFRQLRVPSPVLH